MSRADWIISQSIISIMRYTCIYRFDYAEFGKTEATTTTKTDNSCLDLCPFLIDVRSPGCSSGSNSSFRIIDCLHELCVLLLLLQSEPRLVDSLACCAVQYASTRVRRHDGDANQLREAIISGAPNCKPFSSWSTVNDCALRAVVEP